MEGYGTRERMILRGHTHQPDHPSNEAPATLPADINAVFRFMINDGVVVFQNRYYFGATLALLRKTLRKTNYTSI